MAIFVEVDEDGEVHETEEELYPKYEEEEGELCPDCLHPMRPEHAHYRCPNCGYRDSCCF